MKTAMRKADNESRQLTARKTVSRKKEGAGAEIQDNRQETLAQMKLMESLQAKEDEVQRQAGMEDEEELPKA